MIEIDLLATFGITIVADQFAGLLDHRESAHRWRVVANTASGYSQAWNPDSHTLTAPSFEGLADLVLESTTLPIPIEPFVGGDGLHCGRVIFLSLF